MLNPISNVQDKMNAANRFTKTVSPLKTLSAKLTIVTAAQIYYFTEFLSSQLRTLDTTNHSFSSYVPKYLEIHPRSQISTAEITLTAAYIYLG